MYIAAIEASTRSASVAITDGNKFVEITQDSQLTHSQTLLPQFKEVMSMAKVTREMIDAIAVSIGPGSFTGLRIGLAMAKALAYAWNVKIVGVPTLQSLAYHFPTAKVMSMIDAQKKRAYIQIFDKLNPVTEIEILKIDDALEKVTESEEIIICGDVCHKIKKLPPNFIFAPINLRSPRAINVALCAMDMLKMEKFDNIMNLEPMYIRRSEAEVLWERRHGK